MVEESGRGRGQSSSLLLVFASSGPWFNADINAELVEAVLSHSRARGSARALLATLAAIADETASVSVLSTEDIRSAAGLADSTYRRARAGLLSSHELLLRAAGGGRAKTNHWIIRDPRSVNPAPITAAHSRPRTPNARPVIAATRRPSPTTAQVGMPGLPVSTGQPRKNGRGVSGISGQNPGQHRTVSPSKGPRLSGVSERNPDQNRTVSAQTPPETPSQTPPPNARAGREPQNPRTKEDPPTPRGGGSHSGSVTIAEDYVTQQGRRRQRTVSVKLDEARRQFPEPHQADVSAWQRVRTELEHLVGGLAFEIWLSPLELVATDHHGVLMLAGPDATHGWISARYGSLLHRAGQSTGRTARLATNRELQLLRALSGPE
jgi:hypothetical protein